ncbi:MAG: type II toxin-antitoxin system prevent-host-death family antitoxin [Coriobacteriia bacterium]|nr:type II toxin-antitoxin system prevent-host-death family antitoxin [Coriobacteriia bacterium]
MPLAQRIPETRPVSDLRTHLPEIEEAVRTTGEPIVLTRNGRPSLLVFDCNAYNEQVQRDRHIRKLREAEIEERYRSDTYTLEQSRERMRAIQKLVEALNA